MLVTASRTTASIAHKTAFPAFSSAATSTTVLRNTGLPRFVARQRRHSSSNKHSSTSKQSPATPVASAPKQEGQQQQQQQQPRKRGERALKKTANANGNGQTKEVKGGNGQNGQQQHKSTDAIVTDVKAQLDSMATMPPSVPSTSHYDPKVVHLASLFAQHRPISLNQPVPPAIAKSAFDNIFAPNAVSSKKRTQDVIFTLTSAVKTLENAAAGANGGAKVVTPSPFESSSQQQNTVINLEELGKHFKPFQAPPPPMPMDPKYMQQERVFEENERKAPEATAAEAVDVAPAMSEPKRTITVFRERTLARRKMQLISVKRQRKLKMKKHKYKKLMRRTRNLRRRQDRL